MKPETIIKALRFPLNLLCRVEIYGQENVPRHGAVIVAFNHLGLLDPPLAYTAINRPDASGWVADKHKKNPLFAYLVNSAKVIWINRETADMQALRKALQALKEGRLFGLAPEGTRSPTKAMLPAKEGVSYLAINSGVPVVPAGITGTETVIHDWLRLRKPYLSIRFGKPFTLPPLDRQDRKGALERGTDEIMCRIAALLPPQYRGVYAEHPRLKELLATAT
ncbi:MAG: lysophospholipid acyltransferase family protein [Anaerolineales bacterium]